MASHGTCGMASHVRSYQRSVASPRKWCLDVFGIQVSHVNALVHSTELLRYRTYDGDIRQELFGGWKVCPVKLKVRGMFTGAHAPGKRENN